jgi:high-affinity nickel permease
MRTNKYYLKFVKSWKEFYSGKSPIFAFWILGFTGLIILTIVPLLFTREWSFLPSFDEKTGVIGDTFNGVVSPFIALMATFITFLAFWIQYQANQKQIESNTEQKNQFEKQNQDAVFLDYLTPKNQGLLIAR